MSTSAHPQTDGQSEVTNKTVGTILRILVEDNPDDWASRIADVEFAINSAPSSATGLSPFEVSLGYLPTAYPVASWATSPDVGAESFGERARMKWIRATGALIASRVEMTAQANKRRRTDSPLFQVGSLVYVSTKDMVFPRGLASKFIPKFIGPYPITASNPSHPTTRSLSLPTSASTLDSTLSSVHTGQTTTPASPPAHSTLLPPTSRRPMATRPLTSSRSW